MAAQRAMTGSQYRKNVLCAVFMGQQEKPKGQPLQLSPDTWEGCSGGCRGLFAEHIEMQASVSHMGRHLRHKLGHGEAVADRAV